MPDDRIREARTLGDGAHEAGAFPSALLNTLLGDLGDLAQKEIALAKSEIQQSLMQKVSGAVWLGVAGVVFFVALLTLVGGLVFYVESFDIALHLSAFYVALAVAIVGLVAMMIGRSKMRTDLTPTRSMRQVRRDIAIVKEQVQ